jgi:hypothetical protein
VSSNSSVQVPQLSDFNGDVNSLEIARAKRRFVCYKTVARMYRSGKERIRLPSCLVKLIRLRYPSPLGVYVGFKPKGQNWAVGGLGGQGASVLDDSDDSGDEEVILINHIFIVYLFIYLFFDL